MLRILKINFFFFFFMVSANASTMPCLDHHCIAIVDAGSTGSRLHIYAYDLDKQNSPINIEQIWLNKIKPGLASIEPSPEIINAYLNNLFAKAPEQNLPVYFYATAGMRLVSSPKQQRYYQALNHWFETNSQGNLIAAQTITGREEGVLGWLAVNYKLGSLQSSDKPLVGVMDMGGASVQIAFPADNPDAIDSKDLVPVDIYNRHLTLFVHSFLGLGQTEMSHHYYNESACFSNDYPLPNGSSGKGDATLCQGYVSSLVNDVHKVNQIVSPVLTSNTVKDWYAISGLSSLVNNKPFSFENNQFMSQDMLDIADKELCQKTWQTQLEQYASNEYVYINCLTSSYYYGLVVNGYGLQPSQPIHYLSDSEEIDWTLGVVLHNLRASL